ncbi:MAG: VacJ family lipoprotein [Burkholderiales bacterium]|nr:VacJ family lipoprotein [Burkholderiales bacterium]
MSSTINSLLRAAGLAGLLAVAGCASGPAADPRDPLEPLNRSLYRFNDGVDRALLKPVATAYVDGVPVPVRTGVNNFFGNLRDAWSAFNGVLQLRPREATENGMRFAVNSTFGLVGVLDVASEMGLERTTLDFGMTLGRWGVPDGPYLMLPLLGPSTLRDTVALPVDGQGNAIGQIGHIPTRNELTALRVVDQRAGLLRASDMLQEASLDPYSFLRDSYLQRRHSQIGVTPPEERYDLE